MRDTRHLDAQIKYFQEQIHNFSFSNDNAEDKKKFDYFLSELSRLEKERNEILSKEKENSIVRIIESKNLIQKEKKVTNIFEKTIQVLLAIILLIFVIKNIFTIQEIGFDAFISNIKRLPIKIIVYSLSVFIGGIIWIFSKTSRASLESDSNFGLKMFFFIILMFILIIQILGL